MPDKPRKTLQTNTIPAVKGDEDALPATGVGWPEEQPIPQGAMDAATELGPILAMGSCDKSARAQAARIIAAHTADKAELERVKKSAIDMLQTVEKQRNEVIELCKRLLSGSANAKKEPGRKCRTCRHAACNTGKSCPTDKVNVCQPTSKPWTFANWEANAEQGAKR